MHAYSSAIIPMMLEHRVEVLMYILGYMSHLGKPEEEMLVVVSRIRECHEDMIRIANKN